MQVTSGQKLKREQITLQRRDIAKLNQVAVGESVSGDWGWFGSGSGLLSSKEIPVGLCSLPWSQS
jgi:hypothetical protein